MDPLSLPDEFIGMTDAEQMLCSPCSVCIKVFMLGHGGLATKGHSIVFSQDMQEVATTLPRFPHEVNMVQVSRSGQKHKNKSFWVRRKMVENFIRFLIKNNKAFSHITINDEALQSLPDDGLLPEMKVMNSKKLMKNNEEKNLADVGPAPLQVDITELLQNMDEDCDEESGMLDVEKPNDIQEKKEQMAQQILDACEKPSSKVNEKAKMPWPHRGNEPMNENDPNYFTMAFPYLFPYGCGDYNINRKSKVPMEQWADHLLWYRDGRFAQHKAFKFVVHNIIRRQQSRRVALYCQSKVGANASISEISKSLDSKKDNIGKKILHFGETLTGTSQYWRSVYNKLLSFVRFMVHHGHGLPHYFITVSCAEFWWKPLRRILEVYLKATTGKDVDLSDKAVLYKEVQRNSHIIVKYFDMRVTSFQDEILRPIFKVCDFFSRHEFAKSRGMIHNHGIYWREDRQPHWLYNECATVGKSAKETAIMISDWAKKHLNMTALHPAGKDDNGNPITALWSKPEGDLTLCLPKIALLLSYLWKLNRSRTVCNLITCNSVTHA